MFYLIYFGGGGGEIEISRGAVCSTASSYAAMYMVTGSIPCSS